MTSAGLFLRHTAPRADARRRRRGPERHRHRRNGGLLSATFIDLFFIPFFFVLVSRIFGRKRPYRAAMQQAPATNTPEVN